MSRKLSPAKKVEYLLALSDSLYLKAHENSINSFKSQTGISNYFITIKSSLKCLLIILNQYSNYLDSLSEIKIRYKLVNILLFETESLQLAADHLNKGLAIINRFNLQQSSHKMAKIENEDSYYYWSLKYEILSFIIQYRSDLTKKHSLNHLNSIIKKAMRNNDKDLLCLLNFLKFQYFGMTFTPKQCFYLLSTITNTLSTDLNSNNFQFYQLCSIYEISQHLFRGNTKDAKERYKFLRAKNESLKHFYEQLPVQLIASFHLLSVVIAIQEDDINESRKQIMEIDKLNKSLLLKDNYESWYNTTNGFKSLCKFKLNFNIILNDKSLLKFPLQVKWLTPNEYKILTFFYSGVSYVIKSWDDLHKSSNMFNVCYKLISEELNLVNDPNTSSTGTESEYISLTEIEEKKLRLRYLRLLINYYEIMNYFILNDSLTWEQLESKDKNLRYFFNFIRDYDSKQFSSQELMFYHPIVIRIYFLFGIYSQRRNELQRSQYYFIKVRKLTSSKVSEYSSGVFFSDVVYTTFKQANAGLGGTNFEAKDISNQIYYISTLNLIIVTSFEIEQFKDKYLSNNGNSNALDAEKFNNYKEIVSFRSSLVDELNEMIKMYNNPLNEEMEVQNEKESSIFISVTLDIIKDYIIGDGLSQRKELNISEDKLKFISEVSPFLSSMIYYIKSETFLISKNDTDLQITNTRLPFLQKTIEMCNKYNFKLNDSLSYLAKFKILETLNTYPNEFVDLDFKSAEDQLNLHRDEGKVTNVYDFVYLDKDEDNMNEVDNKNIDISNKNHLPPETMEEDITMDNDISFIPSDKIEYEDDGIKDVLVISSQ